MIYWRLIRGALYMYLSLKVWWTGRKTDSCARGTGRNISLLCDPDGSGDTFRYATGKVEGSNSSDVSIGRLGGLGSIMADACYANGKTNGSLVNTPFVARDLMRIVDGLGEDDLIRFMGELVL